MMIVAAIYYYGRNSSDESKVEKEVERQKRKEESERLSKELEELKTKQAILEKHDFIYKFTQDYMNELSEKWYHRSIKIIIILWILINVLVFILVPKAGINNLLTWNSVALVALNTIAIFFVKNVKDSKNYIKETATIYIESRIYSNRDKNYFDQQVKLYEVEISKLKEDINTKQLEIEKHNDETLFIED